MPDGVEPEILWLALGRDAVLLDAVRVSREHVGAPMVSERVEV
jgi:hypothetical protein